VEAERRVWQQKGEVTKLCSEQLLEASNAYIDLLSARAGEALALAVEGQLVDLLDRTQKLAKIDQSLTVEVSRIQAELSGQKMLLRKVREGAAAASMKLAYLIGLDPTSELILLDRSLAAFNLVDVNAPADALVGQAMTNGP